MSKRPAGKSGRNGNAPLSQGGTDARRDDTDPSPAAGESPLTLGPPTSAVAVYAGFFAAVIAAVICLTTVWAVPRAIGDLYKSVAGGRDVIEGRLGGPDDWSVLSGKKIELSERGLRISEGEPRVWLNQNWGTDLVYYYVMTHIGGPGMLALKALLLLVAFSMLTSCMRLRGVSTRVAVLTSAMVLLAAHGYIDLRPNLTTLTLSTVMLLLMYLSRTRVYLIWVAAALVVLWSNMHGGFIFGIGVMGLWTMCLGLTAAAADGPDHAVRRYWQMPVAVVVAIALCMVVTPYGIRNMTFPFEIQEPIWRTVAEWQPLLKDKVSFGSKWEFLSVSGLLIGLLAVRGFTWYVRWTYAEIGPSESTAAPAKSDKWDPVQRATVVFEFALAAVVIAMALSSRRFVPLAMIQFSPLLARQIEWALQVRRTPWPVLGAAVALSVPALLYGHGLFLYYQPAHPWRPPQPMLARMVGHAQPVDACTFLNANQISGTIFQDWRWEGYLRMRCPQIKIFLGGRAHMIYTGDENRLYHHILSGKYVQALDRLDVNMMLLPFISDSNALLKTLGNDWSPIYCDRHHILYVDGSEPEFAELIRRAAMGELTYPTEHIAALSHAFALTAASMKTPRAELVQAFDAANQIEPTLPGYTGLTVAAFRERGQWARYIPLLEREYGRLEAMDPDRPLSLQVIGSREQIARVLARAYKQVNRAAESTKWQRELESIRTESERTERKSRANIQLFVD